MDMDKVIDTLGEIAAYFRSSFDAMDGTLACEIFRGYAEAAEQALALLKAQEPRVMTLEEVRNCLMIEYRSGKTRDVGPEMFGNYDEWYNKVWRVWTSRPDDATREATPWN